MPFISYRSLVFLVIAISASGLMCWWLDHLTPGHEVHWINACTSLFIVMLLCFYRAVLVLRLQDADMSRAWVLLMLIPPPITFAVCALIFLIIPTDDHPRSPAFGSTKRKPLSESTPQVSREPFQTAHKR